MQPAAPSILDAAMAKAEVDSEAEEEVQEDPTKVPSPAHLGFVLGRLNRRSPSHCISRINTLSKVKPSCMMACSILPRLYSFLWLLWLMIQCNSVNVALTHSIFFMINRNLI